jgi:hypothetical protein
MQYRIDKLTTTLADISVAITVIVFILVLLGIISLRMIFLPIPTAFALIVTINVIGDVYARHRGK